MSLDYAPVMATKKRGTSRVGRASGRGTRLVTTTKKRTPPSSTKPKPKIKPTNQPRVSDTQSVVKRRQPGLTPVTLSEAEGYVRLSTGRARQDLNFAGLMLLRIRDEDLWEHDYDSFAHFLTATDSISKTTAYRLIAIVQRFSKADLEKMGVVRLGAALQYEAALDPADRPVRLLAAEIVFRRRGQFVRKRLSDATEDEIKAATQLKLPIPWRGGAISAATRQTLEQLEALLPAAPEGMQDITRVSAKVARDGQVALTLRAIPMSELKALAKKLLALPDS